MQTLLGTLKSNIIEQNLRLEDEIKKLELVQSNDVESHIAKFVEIYNNTKKIDINTLRLFFDKLESDKLDSIEKYESCQALLDYYEKIDVGEDSVFALDIKKIKNSISYLIIEVNKLREKMFNNIKQVGFRKRELEKNLLYLERIDKIIDNYEKSKYMSEDNCEFLYAYLNENKIISDEEVCELFKIITLTNAKILEQTIKLELLKQNKIQEQEQILQEEILEKKNEMEVEEESILIDSELMHFDLEKQMEENSSIDIQNLSTILDDVQLKKYELSKSLCSELKNIDDKVDLVFKSINKMDSWNVRKNIYETLTLPSEKKQLLLADLKLNILLELDEQLKNGSYDNELFDILEEVLVYYDSIQTKKSINDMQQTQAPKDYIECLKLMGKNEELELCGEVDNLINNLLNIKDEYSDFYLAIKELATSLKEKKDTYIQGVELLFNENDDELMDLLFVDMKFVYEELNNLYKKFIYSLGNNQENLLQLSQEFYDGAKGVKNIIVFCDDDGNIVSNVEEDILEERDFNINNFKDIIKRLQENVSGDLVAQGNHKTKNNKYYSEEFLRKYHVKSLKNGESRTFYSIFNTNLGALLGVGNLKVMFVYLVGYGKNSNKKIDINYEALKRCYYDKDNIDYYVNLLNTDWNLLSQSEFVKKRNEVMAYLKRQNLKLGHLIHTCNKKIKLEEGRSKKND